MGVTEQKKRYEANMRILNFVRGLISIDGSVNMTNLSRDQCGNWILHGYVYNEYGEGEGRDFILSPTNIERMAKLNTVQEMIGYYHELGTFTGMMVYPNESKGDRTQYDRTRAKCRVK